jgi:hypothetical protein
VLVIRPPASAISEAEAIVIIKNNFFIKYVMVWFAAAKLILFSQRIAKKRIFFNQKIRKKQGR